MFHYVGKTVDDFRLRKNNYKMNDRNFLKGQTCKQQHLFEHFASEGHCSFIEDVTIKLYVLIMLHQFIKRKTKVIKPITGL